MMKLQYFLYVLLLCMVCAEGLHGQGYAFGLKVGPTLGTQRLEGGVGNSALLQYHGAVFIETVSEESTSSLFAEAGYHIKGRSERIRSGINFFTGNPYDSYNLQMKFHNVSLSLGGKQRFLTGALNAYYSMALRTEYNLKHELDFYQGLSAGVNKFVYGITLGGGFEFPFGEFVSGILDFRVSPDISRQIFVPPFQWINPITGSEQIFREQSVRNIALEVSVGFRFLHKIIYVDDY